MKKGVAVPYIIALVLGIVVVGLIGYWFFVLGGRLPGQATEVWCNSKESQWCTSHSASTTWDDFAPGCSDIGIDEPTSARCAVLVPT